MNEVAELRCKYAGLAVNIHVGGTDKGGDKQGGDSEQRDWTHMRRAARTDSCGCMVSCGCVVRDKDG